MERNSLNEALKKREAELRGAEAASEHSLDDARRVKVLSPGRLVFKRFVRNKLAVIGTCLLILIFAFAFIGPFFYPYEQTQVFKSYQYTPRIYANAAFRTSFSAVAVPGAPEYPSSVRRRVSSYIETMTANGTDAYGVTAEGRYFTVLKLAEDTYSVNEAETKLAGQVYTAKLVASEIDNLTYTNGVIGEDGEPVDQALLAAASGAFATTKKAGDTAVFTYEYQDYKVERTGKMTFRLQSAGSGYTAAQGETDPVIAEAATDALDAKADYFMVGDDIYILEAVDSSTSNVMLVTANSPVAITSTMTFDSVDAANPVSDNLKTEALLHRNTEEPFTFDGQTYAVKELDGELVLATGEDEILAYLSNAVVTDSYGQDTFSLDFKAAINELMIEMRDEYKSSATLEWSLKQSILQEDPDDSSKEVLVDAVDEDGNVIYATETLTINRSDKGDYEIWRTMLFYRTNEFNTPSSSHLLGTDQSGMDVLSRLMYGGRISLMVGFVVVIISMFLGVIMGGLAGYFGGWVDTIIMRLVEVFYCIPSYPILIILGGFMDAEKMDAYPRLLVMMAVLGFLSWAGTARMVRGQILSLREQEFMVAAEATGLKVSRRIFRHLVPNVMPQLIVSATGSLGGVILTESSLSFLGLGVKYPLATWGNMINLVTTSNENLGKYAYIWIPCGILICLTVIAFNFVGDGLRDAFDPKMKR